MKEPGIVEPLLTQGETDLTHQVSEDMSALMGWEVGPVVTTNGPSRGLSTNVVQSTRVGGATFVKNSAVTTNPKQTMVATGPAQNSSAHETNKSTKQRDFRTKNSNV